MTVRFREGTNQVQTIAAAGGDVKWYAPIPLLSIDSRGGSGPVWSPDGMKMAAIYEGVLSVWPVAPSGEPLGPPRRVTSESAHSPSWQGDSRHILYQSLDQLRIVDIETGETKTVPFNMTWTPAIPKTRVVVHAGKLLDMKSPTMRSNVDVIVTGNKITSVVPHADRESPQGASRRCVEPDGDARPHRVPFAPAEGLRRRAGPRVARVRDHHGPQSRQYALRGGRGSRSQRSRRASRPARLRHRLPDGVEPRLLQDGHRDLERQPVRDGAAARQGARARSDQELRAVARPAAEAHGGIRAQHRRAGRDARDLSGGARRRRQHRTHRRDEPARLLAEAGDAANRV